MQFEFMDCHAALAMTAGFMSSEGAGGHFLWMKEKSWLLPAVGPQRGAFMKSLRDYPARQAGAGMKLLSIKAIAGSPCCDCAVGAWFGATAQHAICIAPDDLAASKHDPVIRP